MLAADIAQTQMIDPLRELLHYYLPPLESTPSVVAGSLAATGIGLFLVFRTGKFVRFVVCAFALMLGGWLGYRLSAVTGTPGPITIAITAVILSAFAYRTYRGWLAVGAIVALASSGVALQLGRSDLQESLAKFIESSNELRGDKIELKSADQQEKNLHGDARQSFISLKNHVSTELKEMGPVGWIIPLVGAILGALLAYWALQAFAIAYLGFIGANMAVIGGSTFIVSLWPGVRDSLFENPQYPAYVAVGLWLVGLIIQARDAKFPKKQGRDEAKQPAKS